jgi:hypothetical protein
MRSRVRTGPIKFSSKQAVLEVHPLAYPMIGPVQMSRMNRQATLVRLAQVRQDSQ